MSVNNTGTQLTASLPAFRSIFSRPPYQHSLKLRLVSLVLQRLTANTSYKRKRSAISRATSIRVAACSLGSCRTLAITGGAAKAASASGTFEGPCKVTQPTRSPSLPPSPCPQRTSSASRSRTPNSAPHLQHRPACRRDEALQNDRKLDSALSGQINSTDHTDSTDETILALSSEEALALEQTLVSHREALTQAQRAWDYFALLAAAEDLRPKILPFDTAAPKKDTQPPAAAAFAPACPRSPSLPSVTTKRTTFPRCANGRSPTSVLHAKMQAEVLRRQSGKGQHISDGRIGACHDGPQTRCGQEDAGSIEISAADSFSSFPTAAASEERDGVVALHDGGYWATRGMFMQAARLEPCFQFQQVRRRRQRISDGGVGVCHGGPQT
ncbi:hypothetical protein V8E36_005022 [Tilletia maclaganii]